MLGTQYGPEQGPEKFLTIRQISPLIIF